MQITFLGTGGGRFNLVTQVRRTGGFYISGALRIHVDPGPGALAACLAYSIDPSKTDAVVATHNHIDHMNDASLMLEAINCHPSVKKGVLVASRSILEGDEYGEKGISSYFIRKLSRAQAAEAGKMIMLGYGAKSAKLMPAPVVHEDRTGFGFVLEMDGARLGYTSDTEYFKGMGRHYRGCDVLIANCLKPVRDSIGGHLHSASTAELLAECSPKLCILTHLGVRMLRASPAKEAKKIERATGVRTIAATDGMRMDAGKMKVMN
jgi:ribonuclease BN (tRNA processing enzyme)